MQQQQYDVVVIGSGIAGLSAAVSAQENGARVCVIERAPAEEAGGNTRHTGAYIRMKSTEELSDDFEEHFAANAGGYLEPNLVSEAARDPENWPPLLKALSFVDPNVVSTLAEEATPTLHWLEGHGVQFFKLDVPFPTSAQPRIVPSGGGLALVEALTKSFQAKGGTFLYETAASSLLQDDDGAVVGVNAIARGNKKLQVRGAAVVVACGGFQGNAEMLTRYLGPNSLNLRTMSVGCHYNKGEGIRMALDIGAAPCGDFGSYHASPMDPRSKRAGPSMYMYPYGILVNKEGRRFVDEGPGEVDETYERVTRRIYAQAGGWAWCVLDAKFADVPNQAVAVRTEHPAIEADSIAQLAKKIDVPADQLECTLAEYNAACVEGKFDPKGVDGLATRGVYPAKSNWARPVDKGPFKAYPIISSIVFTFGGLKTDPAARVLNLQGDAIPGLYAAGEAQGLYYGNYTGATSVLKGAVFGRIAGRDAAALAKQ
ncbi:FAD-dependent tricarballylate dehydrogenase TcuA [Ramlibacter sp. G-1-2-2]|uniref:FAD-dependent tricarballylate dehydrogenase TcuA n=1 Tax=Ramlibacter agri TaxID=2728837 RepID=A0A848HBW4_9BURK|nr:FAD-dependent tricarballylate dehydrogenase TcuA [Ramlibacter agri]NML47572.1 FAD-dependent tricarballylate dehydrogenase TcuA [Ramlibacter agri]